MGCAGLEVYGALGLLRSVAVRASTRGAGVGSELVARITAAARAQGLRELFLLTTTAEHYFPRFGFACVGRESVPVAVQASAEFQGACPSTAIVMRKSLRG